MNITIKIDDGVFDMLIQSCHRMEDDGYLPGKNMVSDLGYMMLIHALHEQLKDPDKQDFTLILDGGIKEGAEN